MIYSRIFSQPKKRNKMYITKANKLTETKYLHLLDVAKKLREAYLLMSKGRCYRVYTEARAKRLRS